MDGSYALEELRQSEWLALKLAVLVVSSYTKVCSVMYDSGSVPGHSIFSPRGNSPESIMVQIHHFLSGNAPRLAQIIETK